MFEHYSSWNLNVDNFILWHLDLTSWSSINDYSCDIDFVPYIEIIVWQSNWDNFIVELCQIVRFKSIESILNWNSRLRWVLWNILDWFSNGDLCGMHWTSIARATWKSVWVNILLTFVPRNRPWMGSLSCGVHICNNARNTTSTRIWSIHMIWLLI